MRKIDEIERLPGLIDGGTEHLFYCGRAWKKLKAKVLKADRYECQICKSKGRYKRADIVHHVNHLKDRPDLALSTHYIDADGNRKRNLISVCKECHETVCHPEKQTKRFLDCKKKFTTPERWD